jgi:hypothetical protein
MSELQKGSNRSVLPIVGSAGSLQEVINRIDYVTSNDLYDVRHCLLRHASCSVCRQFWRHHTAKATLASHDRIGKAQPEELAQCDDL